MEGNQRNKRGGGEHAAGEAMGDPVAEPRRQQRRTDLHADDADGVDSALFAIDWATGQLKTKGDLDFEVRPEAGYTVTVRATDPDGVPEAAVDAIEHRSVM